jgi:Zn-dependent protease with chaperone function
MNFLKTVALLALLSSILVLTAYLLIGGTIGAIIGLIVAAVINFSLWFYSDQVVLAAFDVRPANSQEEAILKPIVEVLCYRANLPEPKLYIIPTSSPNAFATGRNPQRGVVCITEGLMQMLPEDELEAVIAHELSHIKHGDTLTATVAVTISVAISLLTETGMTGMFAMFNYRNANPIRLAALFPTLLLAPLTATLTQLAISRTREYAADAGSASLTGNPRALANALERLENNSQQQSISTEENPALAPLLIINPFKGKLVNRLFATHPPTNNRIQELLAMQPGLLTPPTRRNSPQSKRRRAIISAAIALIAFALAYAPLPGVQQNLTIVSGTELQEPLAVLELQFEASHPNINLELKFQGSQDIVNNYIDQKHDFTPTVLIPANGEILEELRDRLAVQGESNPFYDPPQPIAKTFLVGIAWPERGKVIFPGGRFQWQSIERAMQKRNWTAIGGQSTWGSFDFVMTDPSRSNSGQLTLSLWSQSNLGGSPLTGTNLNGPGIQSLFALIKRSVYQPPLSSDILLQEFIARGSNDADVATTYESIALYRWSQAQTTQEKPYQIYYLDPTIETVATAAIARRDVNEGQAKAAREFVAFLRQPSQQEVFVRYGFRPVISGINLESVSNSPWNQNIPGVQVNPSVQFSQPPDAQLRKEIQRLWQRVN